MIVLRDPHVILSTYAAPSWQETVPSRHSPRRKHSTCVVCFANWPPSSALSRAASASPVGSKNYAFWSDFKMRKSDVICVKMFLCGCVAILRRQQFWRKNIPYEHTEQNVDVRDTNHVAKDFRNDETCIARTSQAAKNSRAKQGQGCQAICQGHTAQILERKLLWFEAEISCEKQAMPPRIATCLWDFVRVKPGILHCVYKRDLGFYI